MARNLIGGLYLVSLAVLSSAYCLSATQRLGPTFDEPTYLENGLAHWRTGSSKGLMRLGTMPLAIDVQTLPLAIRERSTGKPYELPRDLEGMLPVARRTSLVFWWILLGYGYLAGRQLAGFWGGPLAATLLAVEPVFLAHAGLATTDVAISAMLLAFAYHFALGRERSWPWRIGVPAVLYAACVLAKASGLLFGPIVMLAIETDRLLRTGPLPRPFRRIPGAIWSALAPLRRDGARIVGVGLTLVLLYCGSDWQAEPSFLEWAQTLPDSAPGRSMRWLASHLMIFTNAGEGLVQQIKHNVRGHGAYLLGATWPRSVWYYFPVALSIKLSAALLMLPVLAALLRPRSIVNWAIVAAGALLAFSLLSRVQIGVRLYLPLVALLCVGSAAALVDALRRSKWTGLVQLAAPLVMAAVLWNVAEAAGVWPHALCYVNPLWGGTEHGYRLLSDSNYDWGQGLPELARRVEQRGAPIELWYFGTDPAANRPCFQAARLHELPAKGEAEIAAALAGRRIAVSTSLVHGGIRMDSVQRIADYLKSHEPAARTSTFLIYDFPPARVAERQAARKR